MKTPSKLIKTYSFNSLSKFRNAQAKLYKANFYRNGNGNPPTGEEVGIYSEDENWLTIEILTGNIELANGHLEYKKPIGYMVFNHGGYLD
jgi:hypothetical protein